jgi:hypothetical protein
MSNEKNLALVNNQNEFNSIEKVLERIKLVEDLYRSVLKPDQHFGKIPGTKKDTLYKSGAEKLTVLFQLCPKVIKEEIIEMKDSHREYRLTIALIHKKTNEFWGEAVGSCSTMESKYRYRDGKRICPECKKETIIKGKDEYGGGWICFKKNGGCGIKFKDGDAKIESQQIGKIENKDIADIYNTVYKMAYKRAYVAAVIIATNVSDIFTQDLEEKIIKDDIDIVDSEMEYGNYEPKKEVKNINTFNAAKAKLEVLNESFNVKERMNEEEKIYFINLSNSKNIFSKDEYDNAVKKLNSIIEREFDKETNKMINDLKKDLPGNS